MLRSRILAVGPHKTRHRWPQKVPYPRPAKGFRMTVRGEIISASLVQRHGHLRLERTRRKTARLSIGEVKMIRTRKTIPRLRQMNRFRNTALSSVKSARLPRSSAKVDPRSLWSEKPVTFSPRRGLISGMMMDDMNLARQSARDRSEGNPPRCRLQPMRAMAEIGTLFGGSPLPRLFSTAFLILLTTATRTRIVPTRFCGAG